MILLCLSMSVILFFILLLGILVLRWIYQKTNRLAFYGILTVCPILLIVFLSYAPLLKEDFHYTKNAVTTYFKSPSEFIQKKTGYTTGNEVRLIMWTVATLEIMDHPFGVGTGNIDDHLSERLNAFGQTKLAQKDEKESIRFNPHNQFLQTSLEIGLLGGFVLVFYLISAFSLAYKYRNVFFMVVVSSLVFNALFESMLQRQSGIVFYSFLITLLVVIVQQSTTENAKDQEV
jgi:O-antigen ligase